MMTYCANPHDLHHAVKISIRSHRLSYGLRESAYSDVEQFVSIESILHYLPLQEWSSTIPSSEIDREGIHNSDVGTGAGTELW